MEEFTCHKRRENYVCSIVVAEKEFRLLCLFQVSSMCSKLNVKTGDFISRLYRRLEVLHFGIYVYLIVEPYFRQTVIHSLVKES